MADERAAERAGGGAAETAIGQPHDKYFQHVLSNERVSGAPIMQV